jgi:hypothetical protein
LLVLHDGIITMKGAEPFFFPLSSLH